MPPKRIDQQKPIGESAATLALLRARKEGFWRLLAASLLCLFVPHVKFLEMYFVGGLPDKAFMLSEIFGVGAVAVWVPEIVTAIGGLWKKNKSS